MKYDEALLQSESTVSQWYEVAEINPSTTTFADIFTPSQLQELKRIFAVSKPNLAKLKDEIEQVEVVGSQETSKAAADMHSDHDGTLFAIFGGSDDNLETKDIKNLDAAFSGGNAIHRGFDPSEHPAPSEILLTGKNRQAFLDAARKDLNAT